MPLPRKQIMSGSEVSSTCVMVSLSRFRKKYKGDLIIVVAQEILSCPCCEGDLFVRGTCRRQAINSAGSKVQYQLRVLQCRDCRRTHRELPDPLVPYKRYDGEAITYIENDPSNAPSSIRSVPLILGWLAWFNSYANHICESQSLILPAPLSKTSGKTRLQEFIRQRQIDRTVKTVTLKPQEMDHNRQTDYKRLIQMHSAEPGGHSCGL